MEHLCDLDALFREVVPLEYRVAPGTSNAFQPKMTLQWTVVAGILYVEIGVVFLLLLPWIRPNQ